MKTASKVVLGIALAAFVTMSAGCSWFGFGCGCGCEKKTCNSCDAGATTTTPAATPAKK